MTRPTYTPTAEQIAEARMFVRRLRAAARRNPNCLGRVPADLARRLNAVRRSPYAHCELPYFLRDYRVWLDMNARTGIYSRKAAA
jgi:hypothetical protein